jgi:hypothetical protein
MTRYSRNNFVLIIISLLISTAAFILVFFITYTLACMASPPYLVDDNGEKHGLMPIGQTFLGIILGIIAGIVSLFVCYKRLKRKK